MKLICTIFVSILVFTLITTSLICQEDYTEPLFVIKDDVVRCRRIVVGFNENVISTTAGITTVDLIKFPIRNNDIKFLLNQLGERYGTPIIRKAIPRLVWGDTLVTDRVTGEVNVVPDMSQSFSIDFPMHVPIDSVISLFRAIPVVKYAEHPVIISSTFLPDDDHFEAGDQWYLHNTGQFGGLLDADIDAPEAWNITRGSSSISVAFIDVEGSLVLSSHEDLGGKFVNPNVQNGSSHSSGVAGIIGALTNNNGTGMASLGWNTKIFAQHFSNNGYNAVSLVNQIDFASLVSPIINFSFNTLGFECNPGKLCPMDFSIVHLAINRALGEGVILIAAADNYPYPPTDFPGFCGETIPFPAFPASYDGVIAVTATDNQDNFYDLFNHDDWVDISAPGIGILTTGSPPNLYQTVSGTSLSAPLVSALAALILSINNFSAAQVWEIIKAGAEQVDEDRYEYIEGWNEQLGYGRINAYASLKYALENYGGKLTQDLTIPVGETWNFNVPGVQVKLDNGASIIVNGTLNVQGNSSNKVKFTRNGSSGTWGSIIFDGSTSSNSIIDNAEITYASDIQCLNGADVTIQNSKIENCTNGIYIYNSEPSILSNVIRYQLQNGIYGEASGKQPLIQGNEITRTSTESYQGIWFTNYTEPFIINNDISGFHHAIYLGGGTYTYLTDNEQTQYIPNNRLKNSRYGLTTSWGSTTIAGSQGIGIGGVNSIYNNSYFDVFSSHSSTVYAVYNYWGGGSAHGYADGTSELYTTPYLLVDPWGPSSAPILNQGNVTEFAIFNHKSDSNPMRNPISDVDDLLIGINLEREGRINEAVLHYKQMLNRNSFVRPALTSLASISNRYKRNDLLNYFEELVTDRGELKPTLLTLLAAMYLDRGNYNQTLDIYAEIILEYDENYEGVSARLDKFFAVLNYGKDLRLASNLYRN
jgi:thermitase